jgi:hypothetical protein
MSIVDEKTSPTSVKYEDDVSNSKDFAIGQILLPIDPAGICG